MYGPEVEHHRKPPEMRYNIPPLRKGSDIDHKRVSVSAVTSPVVLE